MSTTHCDTCTCHATISGSKRARKAAAPRVAKMTPALAAKFRRQNAELCGCVLCRWSLAPAATIAEHDARMAETARRNGGEGWPTHRDWAALTAQGLAA